MLCHFESRIQPQGNRPYRVLTTVFDVPKFDLTLDEDRVFVPKKGYIGALRLARKSVQVQGVSRHGVIVKKIYIPRGEPQRNCSPIRVTVKEGTTGRVEIEDSRFSLLSSRLNLS